jgi:hypothetical protein
MNREVEDSIAYIESIYRYYAEYWPKGIKGRAAELGPGDNCGVGILLRAFHADEVDLVDRFYAIRDQERQIRIYRQLLEKYPELLGLCNNPVQPDENAFSGMNWHVGEMAAGERFFSSRSGSYAFIGSWAVLEHLYDPIATLKCMAEALVPGGVMVHCIDLRDHGMFSSAGFSELEWLTIPEVAWKLMSKGNGAPNRIGIDKYLKACSGFDLKCSVKVTSLAGSGTCETPVPVEEITPEILGPAILEINKVRNRLCKSLAHISDESLAVTGIILHGTKLG